ncbi:MAG TPA: glutamate--tRNA ligase [Polyangiaceae bacterium]
MAPRVRFAPSPSGYLHLGLARTALFNWLWARKTGGKLVLRIEDTDQERSSPESVRALVAALRWLGLDWDEGPEVGGPHGPYFQSERRSRYQAASDRLIGEGKAYRCYCSKEQLDRARAELKAGDPKAQFVYPGTCRARTDHPDLPSVVRFKAPSEGVTEFSDRVFGRISTPNKEQQDFIILRPDGFPLYNLACVVDDHEMGVTLVARGRDHIGNTPLQILLYRALDWQEPEFAHLPMILGPGGDKLSKRDGAVGVGDYRERGYPPMGVLNYLVRFGWSHGDQEIFSRQELVDKFSWERVNRSDGKFDQKKFLDVAFEQLKRPDLTPLEHYAELVQPFLLARGLSDIPLQTLHRAIETIRERARTLEDAANRLDYYFRDPPEMESAARAKFLVPAAASRLEALSKVLAHVRPWDSPQLEARFRDWLAEHQLNMKEVAQPVRVALTGRSDSPPLFDVMAVLGRERALERLNSAAVLARAG